MKANYNKSEYNSRASNKACSVSWAKGFTCHCGSLQGNYSMGSQDDWWRYSLNTNLTLCSLSPNNPTRLSLNRAPSPRHVFHGGFQKKTSRQAPEPRAKRGMLACFWGPRAGAQAGASCAHTDPKQRVLGCDSCSWLWNKHQAWRDYDRFYLYYETDFTSYMRQKMSVSQRNGNPFAGPELPTEPSSGLLVRQMEHLLCGLSHSGWSTAYSMEKNQYLIVWLQFGGKRNFYSSSLIFWKTVYKLLCYFWPRTRLVLSSYFCLHHKYGTS